MLRQSLFVALLAIGGSGCSCNAAPADGDGAVETYRDVPADQPFVDVAPRDATLPCEDQTIALIPVPVEGSEDLVQRDSLSVGADGDTLVLGWRADMEPGEDEWGMLRVREPLSPRSERIDDLPMPAVASMFRVEGGLRVVFTAESHPRNGISEGGYADLRPDNTFGPLTRFDIEIDGARFVGGARPCETATGD